MSQFAQRHANRRSQELAARAARMRGQATPSEALLWSRLRCRQLGVQFRQQVVVAERFIVDFVAPSARVIVEVDGGWHRGRERADARRQRVLEAAGYRVLRFEAAQVMQQLPVVVAVVQAAVVEGRGGGQLLALTTQPGQAALSHSSAVPQVAAVGLLVMERAAG